MLAPLNDAGEKACRTLLSTQLSSLLILISSGHRKNISGAVILLEIRGVGTLEIDFIETISQPPNLVQKLKKGKPDLARPACRRRNVLSWGGSACVTAFEQF